MISIKISFQKNFKYNYEVLLIYIIYKTNKNKILLIIISGVSLLNTSYYVNNNFLLLIINYWEVYY